ncbi:MAG: hypothetical protein NZ853_11105 [Leptospiraceae bacterium]|nr:hypothetical protein [Leptospiraceae bacterium]MDW7975494.1 hypothetical protein [Leptospiraceae bacterium]
MKIDIEALIDKYQVFSLDEKLRFANWFYNNYENYTPQDIYSWLWLGEFGYPELPKNDLHTLREHIRLANAFPSKVRKIWEPLGISQKFIKINVDLYFEEGFPLLRLLDLVSKAKVSESTEKLTFKNNWNLMKIQIDFTSKIDLKSINEFQEKVPFHMTPYLPFTEKFQQEFGMYYRIVPLEEFFSFFPECIDIYPDLFIKAGISYLEVESEEKKE